MDQTQVRLIVHDYAGHPFQVQLSRELARRGHRVTHAFAGGLLTPRGALERRADDPAEFASIEVAMDPAYREKKYDFVARRGMEVAYGRELARRTLEIAPELMLSANTPTEPQETLRAACARLRVAFVPWVQDFYSEAVARLAVRQKPFLGRLVGGYYRWLEARTLRRSSRIVAITEDFLPMLRRYGVSDQRVDVIPNWAPLDELPLFPRRNDWSAKQGLDDAFCFLYSGTLAMKHNPDLLFQLALRFADRPSVKVVVVSEGPGTEWLAKRRLEKGLQNLVLLGFQRFSEMPKVLASADVLLAILEPDAGVFSVPSKVLSYLCAGRPVLSAIPLENLAARILVGTGAGSVVPPSDIAGFVNAAESYHSDSERRLLEGGKARAYAEANFDIGRISDRFEEVISRAIANRSG